MGDVNLTKTASQQSSKWQKISVIFVKNVNHKKRKNFLCAHACRVLRYTLQYSYAKRDIIK